MTLREHINRASANLTTAGVDAPRLSAQLLAAHTLGCTKIQLTLRAEQKISPAEAAAFTALVHRRASGEPVAYIVGKREFYGRNFTVTPATLIPRPETEEMVEAALRHMPEGPATFADLGTGSGCIAVTLAAERPQWQGFMLDISPEALHVAQRNATTHGSADRLKALHADLTLLPLTAGSLDLLISNPPYVTGEEYEALGHEVRSFEPQAALTPDATGLTHIRAVAAQAPLLLKPGGLCLVEHGYAQGQAVHGIFAATHGWEELRTVQDLSGHDRFCLARL